MAEEVFLSEGQLQGVVSGAIPMAPSQPTPQDMGASAWTVDPMLATTSTVLTGGTIYLLGVWVRSKVQATKLFTAFSTGATTPTAGQSFIGLYSTSGAKLVEAGLDSNMTANFHAVSVEPVTLTAGRYWVALVTNAATPPTLIRAAGLSAAANNMNLAGASLRFATAGTSATALPSSLDPSANSTSGALAGFAGII